MLFFKQTKRNFAKNGLKLSPLSDKFQKKITWDPQIQSLMQYENKRIFGNCRKYFFKSSFVLVLKIASFPLIQLIFKKNTSYFETKGLF